jgi:hypothetical protein
MIFAIYKALTVFGQRKQKTMLRTIRLSRELDEFLQEDADLKRIGVGALLSAILTRYPQWDRMEEGR